MEVLLLTYIVRRVLAHTMQQQHQFGSATITDWAKLCREAMPPATDTICDITYYTTINPLLSIHVTLRYFRFGYFTFGFLYFGFVTLGCIRLRSLWFRLV